jgi:hypothetical protein
VPSLAYHSSLSPCLPPSLPPSLPACLPASLPACLPPSLPPSLQRVCTLTSLSGLLQRARIRTHGSARDAIAPTIRTHGMRSRQLTAATWSLCARGRSRAAPWAWVSRRKLRQVPSSVLRRGRGGNCVRIASRRVCAQALARGARVQATRPVGVGDRLMWSTRTCVHIL